jgi:hypothetical protein
MLTKQNSSIFCIVSFVKKRKRKWSHYLGRPAPFEEKWSIFRGDLPTHSHWSIFRGDLPFWLGLPEIPSGDLTRTKINV